MLQILDEKVIHSQVGKSQNLQSSPSLSMTLHSTAELRGPTYLGPRSIIKCTQEMLGHQLAFNCFYISLIHFPILSTPLNFLSGLVSHKNEVLVLIS